MAEDPSSENTLTDTEVTLINKLRAEGVSPESIDLDAKPTASKSSSATASQASTTQFKGDAPATQADMIRARTESYRERLDDAMDAAIDAAFPRIAGNEGMRKSVCEAACTEIATDADFVAGKLERRAFWRKVREVTVKHAKEQDEKMASVYGSGGAAPAKKKSGESVTAQSAALSQLASGGTTTGKGGRSAGTLSDQNPWDQGDVEIDWTNPPSDQELMEAMDQEAQNFLKASAEGRV